MCIKYLTRRVPSRSQERLGGILLLSVVSATLFLGLLALIIDVGWLYYSHNQLQTAVNAGWRAGYDLMIGTMAETCRPLDEAEQATIRQRIMDLIRENGLQELTASDVRVVFAAEHEVPSTLEVLAEKHLGLFFARTLDMPLARVSAHRGNRDVGAVAGSLAAWVIPFGIPHAACLPADDGTIHRGEFGPDEGFTPGTTYVLKARGGAVEGWPVSIDFGGFGDRGDYERFLRWGYLRPLSIGQEVTWFAQDPLEETGRALNVRMQAGGWRKNVVVPILAPMGSEAPAGIEPPSGRSVAVISGFAEFELTMAPYGASVGQVFGIFRRYLVRPEQR